MYKVFFNASCITISGKNENSFKDNKGQVIEIKNDTNIIDYIVKSEAKKTNGNITFTADNVDDLWNIFKSCFIRIKAAGGLVSDKQGRILVIKRLGFWDLPKGKVEKKESLQNAAVREVEEECGISGLSIKEPLDSIFHIYRSPFHPAPNNFVLKKTTWFEMLYEGNETPVPQQSENIEEVRWFNRDELNEFYANTYPNLIGLVKKYMEKPAGKIFF